MKRKGGIRQRMPAAESEADPPAPAGLPASSSGGLDEPALAGLPASSSGGPDGEVREKGIRQKMARQGQAPRPYTPLNDSLRTHNGARPSWPRHKVLSIWFSACETYNLGVLSHEDWLSP